MTAQNLKREKSRKMDLKLCPRCKQLPDVITRKKFLGYECVIHCSTLGCKLYWPVFASGFNKDKVMSKAATQWNKAVDDY